MTRRTLLQLKDVQRSYYFKRAVYSKAQDNSIEKFMVSTA